MYTSHQSGPAYYQQPCTTNMNSSDHNAMLRDVSSLTQRSDLLHRVSSNPCNAFDSSKRGSTRITKQTSASSSPHHIQRRRTTANHSSRSQPRISYDSQYQTREQRLRTYHQAQGSMSLQRPMSWHPGSDNVRSPDTYSSMTEPAVGTTIAGLENLAVSGTTAYLVQRPIQDAFDMGFGTSMKVPTTSYGESTGAMTGYGTLGLTEEVGCESYPIYSISDPPHQPYNSQATAFNACPTSIYQPSQHWPLYGQDYLVGSQAPQSLPSYVTTQSHTGTARKPKNFPHLVKRKSKELIGMGLYDDRMSGYISPVTSENTNRDSIGKGLKLEETWQPPNEEEDEDDDEAYSTDDAEDVDEAPQSYMTSCSTEAQTAVYPTYGDLSNQSFFFNDDDEYHDDQYANMLAFGQGLSGMPPKTQANPATESYLWL